MSASTSSGHATNPALIRVVPEGDLSRCSNAREQSCGYSITSSARARSIGGIWTPSALAAVRLITRANVVGCSTGKSLGLGTIGSILVFQRIFHGRWEQIFWASFLVVIA